MNRIGRVIGLTDTGFEFEDDEGEVYEVGYKGPRVFKALIDALRHDKEITVVILKDVVVRVIRDWR